ncbi:phage tail assembly chaperone G [Streptococcus suis]
MFEITLKQGGVDKVFKKDYINVEDNLLAVEHQVRQSALYSNEKSVLDPKKHRTLNEAYLQMFVDMYGKQFSVDDLKQADMSVLEVLNDLYLEALGGKKDKSEGEEPKEA